MRTRGLNYFSSIMQKLKSSKPGLENNPGLQFDLVGANMGYYYYYYCYTV